MKAAKFNFVQLADKTCPVLSNKSYSDYFMKWSMKGHLRVQYYNFNEAFNLYEKQEFIESFFQDPCVYETLQKMDQTATPIGKPLEKVEYEFVPCTVTSMTFFNKLKSCSNVVRGDNDQIMLCLEEQVGDFYINDHLRGMLLNPSHESYKLYTQSEREEFIFVLFKHLCLGGEWCQYEDRLSPYLDVTKALYKELLSVERVEGSKEMSVRSVVLKVVAYDETGSAILPENPHNEQNFVYIIIDAFKRQVAVLIHEYGGAFIA